MDAELAAVETYWLFENCAGLAVLEQGQEFVAI